MPAVAIRDRHGPDIYRSHKQRNEFAVAAFPDCNLIQPANDLFQRMTPIATVGIGADRAPEHTHHYRRWDAFSDNVSDRHTDRMVVKLDKIVKVPADLEARLINPRHIQTANTRQLFRDHSPLDNASEPHLLGHLRPFQRLAIEPGVGDSDRALAGHKPGYGQGVIIETLGLGTVQTQHPQRLVPDSHRHRQLADQTFPGRRLGIFNPRIDPHIVEDHSLALERSLDHRVAPGDNPLIAILLAKAVRTPHRKRSRRLIKQAYRAGLGPGNPHRRLSKTVQNLLKLKIARHHRTDLIYLRVTIYLFLCLFGHIPSHLTAFSHHLSAFTV